MALTFNPIENKFNSSPDTEDIDHGGLGGLSDDDHSAYLLASAATDRTTFATNWTDLTDAGATTLHKHDHGGQDGLGDDDHTQYHNNSRGDARYYTQTQVVALISTGISSIVCHNSNVIVHNDEVVIV